MIYSKKNTLYCFTGDRAVLLSSTPDFCSEFKDPVKPVLMPKSLVNLRNSACDNLSPESLHTYCKTVFEQLKVTREEAEKIARETREQHNSASWFSCRAGRVTASQLHAVCSYKQDKPALTTIKNVCYPSASKKIYNAAVTWGIENEVKAREGYADKVKRDHCGFSVETCGFFIHPDIPYMGASPDGMINCECCGRGCLEIKCTYKHRDESVLSACKDKDFCLEEVDSEVVLKKKPPILLPGTGSDVDNRG